MRSPPITDQFVRSILYYNRETGIFYWRPRPEYEKMPFPWNTWNSVHAGKPAGCRDKDGYVLIRINKHQYPAQILAWVYTERRWPILLIDHKDGDRSNNARYNLREATYAENARNRRRHTTTKSGYKGVYRSGLNWEAIICVNYQRISLGRFQTKEEAYNCYCDAAKKHHGEFAKL